MSAPDLDALARHIEEQVGALAAAAPAAGRENPDGATGDPGSGGEWSVTEILAHVAEFIPYWADQAVVVAAREREGEPFGRTHDDAARIAAVEAHARDPLPVAQARVRAAAQAGIAMLRCIPAGSWHRTARHARRGDMNVGQIVEQFIVHHLDEHAKQAQGAAAA